ncbi:hypothetical protein [Pseudochrobactrum asaccharolyticum]|uniref:hypothetical protein n=1 Tax=Pseudochrobactrum asaccharolyticum TaxID=354351 RepID=UPI0011BF1877|nr:hypothetical protein [Pseudochrobactrum asaccharolyticum]
MRSTNNLRKRYETIHGPLCKKSNTAVAYLAAVQARAAIKGILKDGKQENTPMLLKEVLTVFKETHKLSLLSLTYIALNNGGVSFCYQFLRRILQAKIKSRKT